MEKMVVNRKLMPFTFVLVFMASLLSCEKSRDMQTFDDVFDITGIQNLNVTMVAALSVADMPEELGSTQVTIPEGIKSLTPGEIAAYYKKAVVLTDTERDLLLKNDSRTYIEVINRMGSMPPQLGTITSGDFKALNSCALNKFYIVQREETENFYSTDYYSAVVALQNYLKNAVILPMEQINAGKIESASGSTQASVYVLYYAAISLNNIWNIWWAYWSDGTRTKHKGSAGSFPG